MEEVFKQTNQTTSPQPLSEVLIQKAPWASHDQAYASIGQKAVS